MRVVVFEERYERRSDRNHLSRRYVHVVDTVVRDLADEVAVAHHYAVLDETVVLVERLARLRYHVSVLLVGGQVIYYIGDLVGGLVHLAVRRFDIPVLVDTSIARQRGNKTDVLTFGRFDRAHTRIVRVVNVSNLERDVLAVETAGTERGKLASVRKLGNRVGLVHKLRELRRAEKLFNRARHGADVDKRLRRQLGVGLDLHALAHDALQARHTDAELVLQKLAHTAHSAVAEVVDIVARAEPAVQAHNVVDG